MSHCSQARCNYFLYPANACFQLLYTFENKSLHLQSQRVSVFNRIPKIFDAHGIWTLIFFSRYQQVELKGADQSSLYQNSSVISFNLWSGLFHLLCLQQASEQKSSSAAHKRTHVVVCHPGTNQDICIETLPLRSIWLWSSSPWWSCILVYHKRR